MTDSIPQGDSIPLPCPFCGAEAQEGPIWPKHYGCSDRDCGAHGANLSAAQWNQRVVVEPRTPRDPKSLLQQFDNAAAFTQFEEYVVKNYPTNCVIGNPAWHAPKLWRQALYALTMNPKVDAP